MAELDTSAGVWGYWFRVAVLGLGLGFRGSGLGFKPLGV